MHRSTPPLCRKASAPASPGMLPKTPLCMPAHKRPLFCSCQLILACLIYSLAIFLPAARQTTGAAAFISGTGRRCWGRPWLRGSCFFSPHPSLALPQQIPQDPTGIGVYTQPETAASPKGKLEPSLQRDRASSNSQLIPLYFLNETRDKAAMC